MLNFLGCCKISKSPSDYVSKFRPNFQPAIEYISDNTALFLGEIIPKRKRVWSKIRFP